MDSREQILALIKKNQPPVSPLPDMTIPESVTSDMVQKFVRSLGNIGGTAIEVADWDEITSHLKSRFDGTSRWISMIPELGKPNMHIAFDKDPRLLENVSLSILEGHFGVAENGSVWITEENMGDRALPFICEHLVMVIHAATIYDTMQDAYEYLNTSSYNFGTFIAGPSKTADIEQSLVLGAHGPKTLTVFLLHKK
jgi:L-lactate dehydrogenase complex protein LldG